MRKKRWNKRGIGDDVDWIIAIGIFLIYLLMTIVYFKPGIEPVYNPQNLLDIVNNNFNDGAYWTITTQPIFVQNLTCQSSDPTNKPCPIYGNTSIFEFKGSYTFDQATYLFSQDNTLNQLQNLTQSSSQIYFVIPNTSTSTTTATASGSSVCVTDSTQKSAINLDIGVAQGEYNANCTAYDCLVRGVDPTTCGNQSEILTTSDPDFNQTELTYCTNLLTDISTYEAQLDCSSQPSQDNPVVPSQLLNQGNFIGEISFNSSYNLKFIPSFIQGIEKTKYILRSSDRQIDNTSVLGTSSSTVYGACLISNYVPSMVIDTNKSSECLAGYELGASEPSNGVYLPAIASYANANCGNNTNGYECIKKLWGYPLNKDFQISLYDQKQKLIARFPEEPVVPTNANVYSRQFNTFILNSDGSTTPVIVNILVW